MYNRILITGGSGFVGKNLMPYLANRSFLIDCPNSFALNLMDFDCTKKYLADSKPDCIVHLAATCGGIGANSVRPGTFMRNNLTMGLNLINTALDIGCVKKFIMVGSVCSYPCNTPVLFKEEDLWNGYPEPTNAPYGIAKKTLMELLIAYNKQFGFNSVNLIPTNMYGRHDNFDQFTSHVIPAIILKVQNAINNKADYIILWGTGQASREFLHVIDFCRAIDLALQNEPGPEPINIRGGEEFKIIEIAKTICNIMKFDGHILFDNTKPDGQPRRAIDGSKAFSKLKYRPNVNFYDGLVDTVDWFKENIC